MQNVRLSTPVATLRHLMRVLPIFIVTLSACGGDAPFAPSSDAHTFLQQVVFSIRAFNLATIAPYDTVQLHASALLGDGTAAPTTVRYTTSDSALTVDANGFLRVRSALTRGPVAAISATATMGGVTRYDTAFVTVVTGAPVIPVRLVIDDTTWGFNGGDVIDSTLFDRTWPHFDVDAGLAIGAHLIGPGNVPVNGLVFDVGTSDTTVIQSCRAATDGECSLGALQFRAAGRAWFRMSTYAYGTILRDSIQIVVGVPHYYGVGTRVVTRADSGIKTEFLFSPDSIVVPAGSDVSWFPPPGCAPLTPDPNGPCRGEQIDVIFDDSIAQYVLASRIPAAYGITPDVYQNLFGNGSYKDINRAGNRLDKNVVGGAGNIALFGNVISAECSDVIPVTCRYPDAGESRLFTRPGTYHYHSSRGARGVVVVQ